MAPSATGVESATVEWLRYQVPSAARRAMLGNRSASMFPDPSSRVAVGSSSRTTMTIGGASSSTAASTAASAAVSLAPAERSRQISDDDGDAQANWTRN